MWSYEDALAWLYARQRMGIKLGLDKVHALMARLGDPQLAYRTIHVGGTNGKGTITRLLAATFTRAGHKTGAYTSPHLTRFTERIRIDGDEVQKDVVARHLHDLRPHVEALDALQQNPTFFEVTTALAFLVFREAGVDWAVIEVGMGGRLDATNVVRPEACIITNVGRDHVEYLGDTPELVATEKAGIMKSGIPCVTAATGRALQVLKQTSRDRQVPMSVLGEDYHVERTADGFILSTPTGQATYALAVQGRHQGDNAALVVAAVQAMRVRGHDIPEQALMHALATTTHNGRLETLRFQHAGRDIEVLLDGAHNEDGAAALRHHLGTLDWAGFDLIVGAMKDKAWQPMLDAWVPLAARGWGVPIRSPRTLDPEALRVAFGVIPFAACPDVATALRSAAEAGAERILVAGSLWLVGEARATILGEELEEIRGTQ